MNCSRDSWTKHWHDLWCESCAKSGHGCCAKSGHGCCTQCIESRTVHAKYGRTIIFVSFVKYDLQIDQSCTVFLENVAETLVEARKCLKQHIL